MALSLICPIYSRRFRALISGLDAGYGLRASIRDTPRYGIQVSGLDPGYASIRDRGLDWFMTRLWDILHRRVHKEGITYSPVFFICILKMYGIVKGL